MTFAKCEKSEQHILLFLHWAPHICVTRITKWWVSKENLNLETVVIQSSLTFIVSVGLSSCWEIVCLSLSFFESEFHPQAADGGLSRSVFISGRDFSSSTLRLFPQPTSPGWAQFLHFCHLTMSAGLQPGQAWNLGGLKQIRLHI